MRRAEQLVVAQTICKCILECRRYITGTGRFQPLAGSTVGMDSVQFGWRCREAELKDFSLALCEAFERSDSSFKRGDFLRVAIPPMDVREEDAMHKQTPETVGTMFIVMIRNGKRHAVYAAHAVDEAAASALVLGKNEGWEVERVMPKESPGVFRLYDSGWEYVE